MKLNPNFLVHKTGSETIIIPTGNANFSGVVKGNETLGEIVDFLKKEISLEKIISQMCKKYDTSPKVIEEDVKTTISRLKKIGAIDE